MRRLFVGGNWKSNNLLADSRKLSDMYNKLQFDAAKIDVVAFPPEAHLLTVREAVEARIHIGAQNISPRGFGAFTGETTAEQILDTGARWTLIGHSERRSLFGDTHDATITKLKRAMDAKIGVVFCVGESLQERESGATFEVLDKQLTGVEATVNNWDALVIAYEPVWAIGTGKVATPDQASEAHQYIRGWFQKHISDQVAEQLRIIYGGSVTSGTAKDIISKPGIDGFLVGGASLKEDFLKIVETLNSH